MSPEVSLTTGQIHLVMTIVREVLDRWNDPPAWRERLLHGACDLLQGHVASVAGQSLSPDGVFGAAAPIAVVGMDERFRKQWEGAIQNTSEKSVEVVDQQEGTPGFIRLFGDFQRNGWATAARSDITDDQTHYASAFHTHWRAPAGCDDYVMSVRRVDEPNRIEVLTIDRPPGAARFTRTDVLLLKLLHDEIAPLIGVRLATEEHLSVDGLSRRLRETLLLLLDGLSEKQVAAKMELSVPTVHQYVGLIFRHFRVHTRAELMAYFVKRQPKVRD